MSEEQAPYGIVPRPDVEIMVIPGIEWRSNALIFNRRLDEQGIELLFGGLRKFKDGYQWFFSDLWRQLAVLGYEWTDYIPETIALGTAQTWRKVGDMFLPEDRFYDWLQFSHYAATRKLELPEAHKILVVANENKWPEKAVREAVDLVLNRPPRQKNPKVIQCKHCDKWIADIEDEGCPWCMLAVAQQQMDRLQGSLIEIAELRDVLMAIRDSREDNLELFAIRAVNEATRVLEVWNGQGSEREN